MNTAVFIDCENLFGGLGDRFAPVDLGGAMSTILSTGKIAPDEVSHIAAFGPWGHDERLTPIRESLQTETTAFVETEVVRLSDGRRKSLLDTKLVVDALTYEANPGAERYVIVSGDSDMIPLVRALKARGRRVVGAARTSDCSKALRNLCDLFIFVSPPRVEVPHVQTDQGSDAAVRQLRLWIDEIIGDHREMLGAQVGSELARRIRSKYNSDPIPHYESVLGASNLKSAISTLFPEQQIFWPTNSDMVCRGAEAAGTPRFRGNVTAFAEPDGEDGLGVGERVAFASLPVLPDP